MVLVIDSHTHIREKKRLHQRANREQQQHKTRKIKTIPSFASWAFRCAEAFGDTRKEGSRKGPSSSPASGVVVRLVCALIESSSAAATADASSVSIRDSRRRGEHHISIAQISETQLIPIGPVQCSVPNCAYHGIEKSGGEFHHQV